MYFDSFAEFLRMGNHGLYVWVAYGSTLLVLLSAFFITRSMSRSVEENIRWAILSRQAEQASGAQTKQEDGSES